MNHILLQLSTETIICYNFLPYYFMTISALQARKGGWRYLDTGQVLIESACSVDRVEEALSTLLPMLPEIQYFRFNPGICCFSVVRFSSVMRTFYFGQNLHLFFCQLRDILN